MRGSAGSELKIVISKNGPYLVQGVVPPAIQAIVPDEKGDSQEWKQGATIPTGEKFALCQCGGSARKPFCDGTHARSGFDGSETASKGSYEDEAGAIDGPTLLLTDKSSLCAGARFCDPDHLGSVHGFPVGRHRTPPSQGRR